MTPNQSRNIIIVWLNVSRAKIGGNYSLSLLTVLSSILPKNLKRVLFSVSGHNDDWPENEVSLAILVMGVAVGL